MPSRRVVTLALVLAAGAAGCKSAGQKTASQGEAIFHTRCAVCHSAGEGNGQGPGLAGVVGRAAASGHGFSYSSALKASALTWDAATLDRFLTSPATVVPGTTMPIATPNADERRALIAYLGTLQPGAAPEKHSHSSGAPIPPAPPGLRTGAAAFGDYRTDGPGVRRHFTVSDLPAPFATPSAHNGPSIAARPDGALPRVPAGFTVDVFAHDLQHPRAIRVAPNGDAFVAETAGGVIRVLRANDGATTPEIIQVYATGLDAPFGMAFYPPGPDPRWLYVANLNAVVRFPYKNGDVQAAGAPEIVVPKLTDSSGGHTTRDVAFSKDGARMFVSVGSASNVAQDMPKRSVSDAHAWEATHGLGASWGEEENRADVLVFTPDGKNQRAFATGIRNCVGLAVSPETGELWCSTNERDGLGDNLVPDYITRVREGGFYGWPWIYLGDHEDPRHAGERSDLVGKVTVPDVLLQAHSASLEMAFYEGAMFPQAYRGNVFAALHGSWNRASRTGPKVVRVPVVNGVPTGEYEDFMTGFVSDDEDVWGRPVGVAVAKDGALLVTEDGNGIVWRVSAAATTTTTTAGTGDR